MAANWFNLQQQSANWSQQASNEYWLAGINILISWND